MNIIVKKMTRHEHIAVFIGLILVAGIFIIGPIGLFPAGEIFDQATVSNSSGSVPLPYTVGNLIVEDKTLGEGAAAAAGDRIAVHYVGQLSDGTVFDSSVESDIPFVFTLGRGEVILGWDQGIVGMRPGGRRVLTIPPELGYGESGVGPIPPNATLIFEVALVAIERVQE